MILSNGVICKAATESYYAEANKNRIHANYTHTEQVSIIQIKLHFYEVHTQNGQKYNDICYGTSTGGCTYASATRYADTGYVYTGMYVWVLVNGHEQISNRYVRVS
ncbi:MAG: hypothetical protein IKJ01_01980 [Lachnospiraceae bacterium]|nr:hypothetical protein [Lachnospiraceae bacterium]